MHDHIWEPAAPKWLPRTDTGRPTADARQPRLSDGDGAVAWLPATDRYSREICCVSIRATARSAWCLWGSAAAAATRPTLAGPPLRKPHPRNLNGWFCRHTHLGGTVFRGFSTWTHFGSRAPRLPTRDWRCSTGEKKQYKNTTMKRKALCFCGWAMLFFFFGHPCCRSLSLAHTLHNALSEHLIG